MISTYIIKFLLNYFLLPSLSALLVITAKFSILRYQLMLLYEILGFLATWTCERSKYQLNASLEIEFIFEADASRSCMRFWFLVDSVLTVLPAMSDVWWWCADCRGVTDSPCQWRQWTCGTAAVGMWCVSLYLSNHYMMCEILSDIWCCFICVHYMPYSFRSM